MVGNLLEYLLVLLLDFVILGLHLLVLLHKSIIILVERSHLGLQLHQLVLEHVGVIRGEVTLSLWHIRLEGWRLVGLVVLLLHLLELQLSQVLVIHIPLHHRIRMYGVLHQPSPRIFHLTDIFSPPGRYTLRSLIQCLALVCWNWRGFRVAAGRLFFLELNVALGLGILGLVCLLLGGGEIADLVWLGCVAHA